MSKKADKKSVELISGLGRQFSDTTIMLHEAIASKAGLSGADHKYLGILMQKGAMTAGQLSNLTGLTTGAITGVIDRLEKKKLVKRELGKEDRRKIMIVPDYENAMNLLGGTFNILQNKIVSLMETFSEQEAEIIEKYLKGAIDAMNEVVDQLKALDNHKH